MFIMSNNNQDNERNTHCWGWGCHRRLSSKYQDICPYCGWIICPDCDTCAPHCNRNQIQELERKGFDRNGVHKNGTLFDDNGVDCNGVHKDREFYVGKRVIYPSLYGKGKIKDCYFKDGFLRVEIIFDNKKTIRDLAIEIALRKGIIKYIEG